MLYVCRLSYVHANVEVMCVDTYSCAPPCKCDRDHDHDVTVTVTVSVSVSVSVTVTVTVYLCEGASVESTKRPLKICSLSVWVYTVCMYMSY